MDEVRVAARVVPTRIVLSEPWKFQGRPLVCLELSEAHIAALRAWAGKHDTDDIVVSVTPAGEWSERAKRFVFLVRDRLAAAAGETTRTYKDHLYQQAKREAGLTQDGKPLSIKDMNKEQIWELTNLLLDWAEKAGIDQSDFRAHLENLREE